MPTVVSLMRPMAQVALAGCDLGIYPEEGRLANNMELSSDDFLHSLLRDGRTVVEKTNKTFSS